MIKRKYLYGSAINNFVNTKALDTYRRAEHLTIDQLRMKINPELTYATVAGWCSKQKVPKVVLKQLGLRASGGGSTRQPKEPSQAKGEIYIAYVDRSKEAAFKAFCDAMNINVKTVL